MKEERAMIGSDWHSVDGTPALRALGPSTPQLREHTIGEDLRRYAHELPDHLALVDVHAGRELTASQFDGEVDVVAAALESRGVGVGDRVGLWSTNRSEWILVQYAAARVGAILVCINPSYEQHDLAYVLGHSDVSLLLHGARSGRRDLTVVLATVIAEHGLALESVNFDDASWTAFLDAGRGLLTDDARNRWAAVKPASDGCIMYTSGTTGSPKAALQSQRSLLNNGFFVGETLDLNATDRLCLPPPLFHVLGCSMGVIGAVTHRATVVLTGPRFEAKPVIEAVRDYACTVLYGVPTMFLAELEYAEAEGISLSSLRTGIVAGAACPPAVLEEVIRRFDMEFVVTTYGMTEIGVVSSTRYQRADSGEVRSNQSVMPHVELQLLPASEEEGESVSTGEIVARGYSVMRTYWGDVEAAGETVSPDGWLHTGDIGVVDDEGQLQIVGRAKDMIIRGGENIYPAEIEAFLATHDGVEEAYVVGVDDATYGEEVAAFVRLHESMPFDEADLMAFCEGRIARYKIPRIWHFVTDFPQTATGKVQKFRLRELADEARMP